MIKVLQVVGGMNRAGAETMLMNIYRTIDRTQVQFDFLVYSKEKQDYEEEIQALGGSIIRVPISSSLELLQSIITIRRILQRNGPYTAIHCHTLLNSALALLASVGMPKLRKIVHSHTTCNSSSPHGTMLLYEMVTKVLIRYLSDVWLACGEEAGRYLFGANFVQRGKVLTNGIKLERFHADYSADVAELKSEFGLGDELVIGSVARLEPVKNHIFMLKVARELDLRGIAFKLLFVGKGTLLQQLKQEVEILGLKDKVLFLGVREDIPALMHLFDVFFMPSLFEGVPMCLIEAQACGLPCVISSSIPVEVDLGAGLIHPCLLEQPYTRWVDMLLIHNRRANSQALNMEMLFQKRGYNISESAQYLQNVYLSNN